MSKFSNDGTLSRRGFMSDVAKLAAAGVVAGWTPIYQVAANAQTAVGTLPDFPADIALGKQVFVNWSQEIRVEDVWTATPRTPEDVVKVVNWALTKTYRVRPRGAMHNWSPLTLAPGAPPANVVLLDTTQFLKNVHIETPFATPGRVRAQTGVTLENLLLLLEGNYLGVTATPAIGVITLGGALAIDAHGTAIPARGEKMPLGGTYGSWSNRVIELTAVVFDQSTKQYVLKTFFRDDPDIAVFLAHLGRAFVTEVVFIAEVDRALRCQSMVDIPATELFGPDGSNGRTVESFLDQTGRMEAIWFPYTKCPWLKVWSFMDGHGPAEREASMPYNYAFSDSIPLKFSDLIAKILFEPGRDVLTPEFCQGQMLFITECITHGSTADIWSKSAHNLQLYIQSSTLRETANGYAVLMRRADVQGAINKFFLYVQSLIDTYTANKQYPVNGPVEIRVTGLDHSTDISADAVGPAFSALKPRPDHYKDWDVAVWFDILTLPGTKNANRFYRELEQWMLSTFSGTYASVRPEWSKGWGYTDDTGAWQDDTMIRTTIPKLLSEGQPEASGWKVPLEKLDSYDPHRIFASPLLDKLMP
jgi:FAD/FMN-containing dehydrogenase